MARADALNVKAGNRATERGRRILIVLTVWEERESSEHVAGFVLSSEPRGGGNEDMRGGGGRVCISLALA